jgi:disulfide bond formation protein DsbB
MMIPRLRVALALMALLAGAALGIALASEYWGGLVPCPLCLVERWPYRIMIALGLVGLILPRALARTALALGVLAALAGAAASFVHVGVEQKWWPSPMPECIAPNLTGLSMAERLARMPATPSKSCEDPSYFIDALPISISLMNMLYALALAAGFATFLWTTRKDPP